MNEARHTTVECVRCFDPTANQFVPLLTPMGPCVPLVITEQDLCKRASIKLLALRIPQVIVQGWSSGLLCTNQVHQITDPDNILL